MQIFDNDSGSGQLQQHAECSKLKRLDWNLTFEISLVMFSDDSLQAAECHLGFIDCLIIRPLSFGSIFHFITGRCLL